MIAFAAFQQLRLGMPLLPSRRRWNLVLVCVGIHVLCLTTAAGQAPAVRQAFERGAAAMRNGQPAAAEQAFRDAVKLAPSMAEAHLDLGLVLGREGKLAEAIQSLQQAIILDPSQPSAGMFLGIFLFQSNRPDEARAALQKELSREPDNVEALVWLGNVELATAHPDRAAAALDKAAEKSPDNLDLLELRGKAHSQVARDSYARMAKLEPDSWHVHRVQAQIFADEGKHAEAVTEYQAAIKQQTRNPDLYEALGDEYRASSQLEAAQAAYQTELKLAPTNPVAMYNAGSVAIERGDSAAGVPLLQAMVKVYPGSPVAEYYLGRGLASLGKDQEAANWLQKSATGDHNGEIGKRSYYELTRIYRKLHRTEDAQAALADYNRIREAQEKASTQQVQDWKKLAQPTAESAAATGNSQP